MNIKVDNCYRFRGKNWNMKAITPTNDGRYMFHVISLTAILKLDPNAFPPHTDISLNSEMVIIQSEHLQGLVQEGPDESEPPDV